MKLPAGTAAMDRDALLEQAQALPDAPGIYIFKDAGDIELYVGKAKSLARRVRQYFDLKRLDEKTALMVGRIAAIEYVETASEVEALMLETRTIKDLQPKFNVRLRSSVNYPLVEITWGEDFPRVLVTRDRGNQGSRYYGPFTDASGLRAALRILQRVFKFRSCNQKIEAEDPRRRFARPCLNHYIGRSSAPCAARIEKTEYRRSLKRLALFLNGRTGDLLKQLDREMKKASGELRYEDAAVLRDQLRALESLERRGDLDKDGIEPAVPAVDLHAGPAALQKALKLEHPAETVEGIDISHTQGGETVASVVTFRGGFPERGGYRRFRIGTVEGVDDFDSIREVVRRRYGRMLREDKPLPDLILIDGGIGQLRAAEGVLRELGAGLGPGSNSAARPLGIGSFERGEGGDNLPAGVASRAAEDSPVYGDTARIEGDSPAARLTLVSLSKQEELVHTLDLPAGVRISRRNLGLRMLQFARDEAHRFAQHYHHILQRKRVLDI